jgi:hypothetical protein
MSIYKIFLLLETQINMLFLCFIMNAKYLILVLVATVLIGGYLYFAQGQPSGPAKAKTSSIPFPACAHMVVPLYFSILNSTGFNVVKFQNTDIDEYIIAPGNSGTITFNISQTPANIIYPMSMGFFWDVTSAQELVGQPEGLSSSFSPATAVLNASNPWTLITLTISVDANAPKKTYFSILPICDVPSSAFAFLTIGTNPHSGPLVNIEYHP